MPDCKHARKITVEEALVASNQARGDW